MAPSEYKGAREVLLEHFGFIHRAHRLYSSYGQVRDLLSAALLCLCCCALVSLSLCSRVFVAVLLCLCLLCSRVFVAVPLCLGLLCSCAPLLDALTRPSLLSRQEGYYTDMTFQAFATFCHDCGLLSANDSIDKVADVFLVRGAPPRRE